MVAAAAADTVAVVDIAVVAVGSDLAVVVA